IALMRERAAVTKSTSQADASKVRTLDHSVARVLDSPEQRTLEQERIRNNARANLGQFFKLLNLPADQQEQYVDLQVDMEQRKANRISALLQENISVA